MKCFIIATAFAALVTVALGQNQQQQKCMGDFQKCQTLAPQGPPPGSQGGSPPDVVKVCGTMKTYLACIDDLRTGDCGALFASLPPEATAGMTQSQQHYDSMCGTLDKNMAGATTAKAMPKTTAAPANDNNGAGALSFSFAAVVAVVVALIL